MVRAAAAPVTTSCGLKRLTLPAQLGDFVAAGGQLRAQLLSTGAVLGVSRSLIVAATTGAQEVCGISAV